VTGVTLFIFPDIQSGFRFGGADAIVLIVCLLETNIGSKGFFELA
jgi:hypothetical protein